MIRSSRFGFRAAALLVATSVPLLLLAGCGSGNGSSPTAPGGGVGVSLPGPFGPIGTGTDGGITATPTPTPTPTPVSGTRYYQSTFPLTTGGTAIVNLTALADGSATGTLTLDDGRAAAVKATSRVVLGTGNVTGTVNFSTGAVNISGSVIQNGVSTPISVTGTAPSTSGTGGVANLTLGTATITAQWVVSTTGPITSNNNNGGNASGSASALTFSSNSSNITTGNLNAAAATAIKQTVPFVGDILTISAADIVNGTPRAVSVIFTGITPAAGTAYDLSGGNVSAGYTEGNGSVKAFEATGGTVTVVSISGKTYNLKLQGVRVTAQTGNPVSTGTGSFTIDGTITATLP